MGFTGFYWVLLGWNGFYWASLFFTVALSGFYLVLLGFTWLTRYILGIHGLPCDVLGFTGFLPSFPRDTTKIFQTWENCVFGFEKKNREKKEIRSSIGRHGNGVGPRIPYTTKFKKKNKRKTFLRSRWSSIDLPHRIDQKPVSSINASDRSIFQHFHGRMDRFIIIIFFKHRVTEFCPLDESPSWLIYEFH